MEEKILDNLYYNLKKYSFTDEILIKLIDREVSFLLVDYHDNLQVKNAIEFPNNIEKYTKRTSIFYANSHKSKVKNKPKIFLNYPEKMIWNID